MRVPLNAIFEAPTSMVAPYRSKVKIFPFSKAQVELACNSWLSTFVAKGHTGLGPNTSSNRPIGVLAYSDRPIRWKKKGV